MTTKEKILHELNDLDEEELKEFHELVLKFLQSRQQKFSNKPSLLERLSQIQINGPEDFAENIDLYLTGEKQFDPDPN